ncbi:MULTISPECIES: hypothetical protein [Cyanophyceae]|uniref:hypothetical protein n=1 Tax=Cyanophyceae TaxID=3028117 RepID=UPI00168464DD|nr:hypothetical protein [Trichocoleus sp. FACHB-40]MBD2004836.1 hypothetical protein [Trichocoleus sp. FACHB-40]
MILPALLLSLYSAVTPVLPLQPNPQIIVQRPTWKRMDRQVTVSVAIALAKEAANKQKSPPRIYAYYGPLSVGGSPDAWPDKPGSVQTGYNTCGAPPPPALMKNCNQPMTLTTVVNPRKSRGGYTVIFESRWGEANSRYNSWQFDVGVDRRVTFVGEKGDGLPPMVQ